MPKTVNVFYSWQSDLPNNTNRGFIGQALELAAREIIADVDAEIQPVIDRDTAGVPGSPDIRQTIFSKIEACEVFVADVSIIGKVDNRFVCNPNVLVELGYALKTLGDNRVLLLHNDAFGRVEDLPFDLRGRRVIAYDARESQADRSAERKSVAARVSAALRAIATDVQGRSEQERKTRAIALLEAARTFRSDRLVALAKGLALVPLVSGPQVVIHCMPLESFGAEPKYDVQALCSEDWIRPMGHGLRGWAPVAMNIDGASSISISSGEQSQAEAYTHVFRNGVIEAVRSTLLNTPRPNTIHLLRYEETVREYLPFCFRILQKLGCRTPVAVGISLNGVRGRIIINPDENFGMNVAIAIDRDVLSLPEFLVDDFNANLDGRLRTTFDVVWNAGRLRRSPYFNADGKWIGRGR